MKRLVLVGDSDIAFWPKDLLPSPGNAAGTGETGFAGNEWDQPLVSGHSGATLDGVLPHLRKVLHDYRSSDGGVHKGRGKTKPTRTSQLETNTLFVVACAGENDIGEGLSLEKSTRSLSEFVDVIVEECDCKVVLIFLGPKFEPWLEDDPSYKKKYAAMGRTFGRCLNEHQSSNKMSIYFIDCLTMFCGETANLPGARLGGRARADLRYFVSDGLHLSREGYTVWNEVVENTIQRYLTSSK